MDLRFYSPERDQMVFDFIKPGRPDYTRPVVWGLALVAFLIVACAAFGVRATPASEERLRFLMEWAGDVTGYETRGVELPPIIYESHEQLQVRFYGAKYFEYQGMKNVNLMNVLAVYESEAQIMFLDESVDYTEPINEAILLREVTHHLQEVNGKSLEVACFRALEPEAYHVQSLWMQARGEPDIPDPFTVMLIGECNSGYS